MLSVRTSSLWLVICVFINVQLLIIVEPVRIINAGLVLSVNYTVSKVMSPLLPSGNENES